MKDQMGLTMLAAAIIIAAYLIAMSRRYDFTQNQNGFVAFDHWTGKYIEK